MKVPSPFADAHPFPFLLIVSRGDHRMGFWHWFKDGWKPIADCLEGGGYHRAPTRAEQAADRSHSEAALLANAAQNHGGEDTFYVDPPHVVAPYTYFPGKGVVRVTSRPADPAPRSDRDDRHRAQDDGFPHHDEPRDRSDTS